MIEVKQISVGIHTTNCYFLACGGDACFIDPDGVNEAMLDALTGSGAHLRYILLTHGHFDHVGGVAALHERFPAAEIYLSALDAAMTHSLFPLNAASVGAKSYGEGDELPFGDSSIHVFATPGHTRGSVTLAIGEHLFTGDTLFKGSYGRTDLAGGDSAAMRQSLKRLKELSGDRRVYPGHGPASTLDQEREFNSFLR